MELHELRKRCKELRYALEVCEPVLAMGELIAHLGGEQDRARREFDAAFARFARR